MRFWGLLLAAAVTGAGGVPSAAPVSCSSSVPAPGASTPAGAASATASPGRCERAQESSRLERRCGHSSGRERSRSGGKRGRGRSPSPACFARLASVSASSSSESSDSVGRVSAIPSPPSSLLGAGGGRSGSDRSASGCARSPQPGPSGLGSGMRAALHADRSCSEPRGHSLPAPSGVAEEDHNSVSGSVDLDRDDLFRSVLYLIREFHSIEEPASVAPNRCKTSVAPIYRLQSESSPALHLPLSPLLSALLEDTNLALAKFVEDHTVHGLLPVPGRRHRRCYKTASSSFPGPYTVPPGLASITLDKVSESQKRSVFLSHSQVSSMETMLSSVCEVTSWLDWWLSTCGSFREHLPDEVLGNFERLMLSGLRALEFLGSQGVTAVGNLMLSHRDSLLLDARSMVPAEEVAHLRVADLSSSSSIFPIPLLDSALTKMRAASNDALVHWTLHPRRFLGNLRLDCPRQDLRRPPLLTVAVFHRWFRGHSSRLRLTPPLALPSVVGRRGVTKVRRPFRGSSGGSDRSGGKGKGARKKSS